MEGGSGFEQVVVHLSYGFISLSILSIYTTDRGADRGKGRHPTKHDRGRPGGLEGRVASATSSLKLNFSVSDSEDVVWYTSLYYLPLFNDG